MENCSKIEIFFSKKIKQLRVDKNLSLEKAGNLIGIPMVELYKYEELKLHPTLSLMDRISKAYNIPIKSLCSEEKEDCEIVAYKLLIRSFLEIKNYPIMILFETIVDKQEYLNNKWVDIEAYFTRKEGEVIIEVIKNMHSLPYQTIRWDDYMKYKTAILNPQKKIKKKKESYESTFGNYEPYSGKFEDILEKYGKVTAEGLVESALDKVKIIEDLGYDNLVISIKSSDVMMCVKAHELIATKTNYPLHVGITESGTVTSGNIKSAIGLGLILNQGIGDTIRVSLTDNPVEEIASAKLILKTLGLRKGGISVVSCPTCGRTQIDLIGLAKQVEKMVSKYDLDIKVAVMGCVVNGPGEAREADLGIAGGKGEGLLIKKGEIVKRVPENELLNTLEEELKNWRN